MLLKISPVDITKQLQSLTALPISSQLDLIADLKRLPFSLMLDGSNDTGVLKCFLWQFVYFILIISESWQDFFDMNLVEGRDASTAAEMFSSVDKLFIKRDISWDFITALGVDNTNANIGEHSSLKSKALEKNYNTFLAECSCHILHNAACISRSRFATATGFDIEDHCVLVLLAQ